MKIIKTSDISSIQPFLKELKLPEKESHKGQNGRVLIIGGSTLFHAASLWAAEIASHFVDIVHYSSTEENNEVFLRLKEQFRNGIIVHKKDIPDYVTEDDAILVGPGMIRNDELRITNYELGKFKELLSLTDEAEYTYYLTEYLIKNFPQKKFVFDAGALQMMKPEWLQSLKMKPIITPHQLEFQRLFGIDVESQSLDQKAQIVEEYARKYSCTILLKSIKDIISDGEMTVVVEGGNEGLTKGGSGDVLAGITVSLFTRNDPLVSAIIASFVEKKAAEVLSETHGSWYNITNLINQIPQTFHQLIHTYET